MRDDIREPAQWKKRRPRTGTRIQEQASLRQPSKTRSTEPGSFSVAALDAAFEDVDLTSAIPQPHRVDSGVPNTDTRETIVEQLAFQLSALEAQCHHLQGLLRSAKS